MRRALKRADDGKTLDPTEVEVLLSASGDALGQLMATPPGSGTRGWPMPVGSGIITYSKRCSSR